MNTKETLLVADHAKLLVTVKELPVEEGCLSLSAEPIVLSNAAPPDEQHASGDRGNVRQANVHDDVVPPAFAKVGQDVLEGQLDHFVEHLPKVQHVGVSNDERSEEPIAEVHAIVVVKVVPNVAPLELTVVIIRVHLLSHRLVQGVVKEAKEFSSLLGSEIEHKDEPCHVG